VNGYRPRTLHEHYFYVILVFVLLLVAEELVLDAFSVWPMPDPPRSEYVAVSFAIVLLLLVLFERWSKSHVQSVNIPKNQWELDHVPPS
jgi:hypothetical protein